MKQGKANAASNVLAKEKSLGIFTSFKFDADEIRTHDLPHKECSNRHGHHCGYISQQHGPIPI